MRKILVFGPNIWPSRSWYEMASYWRAALAMMISVVVMMTPYTSVRIVPNSQPACLYASGNASTPVPMAAFDTFMLRVQTA